MKTKTTIKTIAAYRTGDPLKIGTILKDIEKLELPETIYQTAADIARTVERNTPSGQFQTVEIVAAYIMRYALMLSRARELTEALPKPKRQKKPE